MGYENRLYFVEKIPHKNTLCSLTDPTKFYSHVISFVEMGNYPALSGTFAEHGKETDCYFFSDDGNTEIVRDRYDAPLKELPLYLLKGFTEKELAKGVSYRMLIILDKMLDDLLSVNDKYFHRNIVALRFGHWEDKMIC